MKFIQKICAVVGCIVFSFVLLIVLGPVLLVLVLILCAIIANGQKPAEPRV